MFGLYPAGPNWVRTFQCHEKTARDMQRTLVEHAGFTAAIFHQPFGESRGAVLAQFGKLLVLSATTPRCIDIAVTPTVEVQHLLWSYREGYATQWSPLEIRALTGHANWDELLTGTQRDFARVCDWVEGAIDGTLAAPQLPVAMTNDGAARSPDTVHVPFPNDDDEAFILHMVELSNQSMEVPPCGL
jgi:hypothetical protein